MGSTGEALDDVEIGDLSAHFEESLVITPSPKPLEYSLFGDKKGPEFLVPKLVSKKVDMKRLKDGVLKLVREDGRSLKGLVGTLPEFYSEEREEITPHLVFMSMLHIASESGCYLERRGEDVVLRM